MSDERIAELMLAWLNEHCPPWNGQPVPDDAGVVLALIQRIEAQILWLESQGFDAGDHWRALASFTTAGPLYLADQSKGLIRTVLEVWRYRRREVAN